MMFKILLLTAAVAVQSSSAYYKDPLLEDFHPSEFEEEDFSQEDMTRDTSPHEFCYPRVMCPRRTTDIDGVKTHTCKICLRKYNAARGSCRIYHCFDYSIKQDASMQKYLESLTRK
ncbi:uncharacterized protein [Clytia hemisphaerica]